MIKLEIGAGENQQDGYLHHDIRPLDGIDIVCDARSFPDEEKNKYDEVYASNILEHFNRFEVEDVLREWGSLVKEGGELKIIVPDIREIMRQYVYSMITHEQMVYLVYGGNDYEFNKHYYGFDVESLKSLFEKVGFRVAKIQPGIPFEKRDKFYCPMIIMTGVRTAL